MAERRKQPKPEPEEPLDLSVDEFFAVSRRLERHHAVFYKLWELGVPLFTKSIPTAAVCFDKVGRCIQFMFNPDFWRRLDDDQRDFVISHECLHVILNHGARMRDSADKSRCNVAMDVVVNQMLLEKFGFDRDEIDLDKEYCWLDNVFSPPEQPGETFEYYFNRTTPSPKRKFVLVDIHDFLDGSEAAEAIGRLNDDLSPEEKDEIKGLIDKHFQDEKDDKKGVGRGDHAGSTWKFMKAERIRPKRKWETVIRRWTKKLLRNEFDYFEHWIRINRRLVMLPEDIVLPTEMETQEREDDGKIQLYFFLDTSGSCSHLAERFWKAAMSVPSDRFEKRLFCFDTKVYDVNEKDKKLYGFGGTSFDILEQRIRQDIKKGATKSYPQAVFVITDGHGTRVQPEKAERWHWFLSDQYVFSGYSGGSGRRAIPSFVRDLIPKKCKLYNLSDFE
jgi:predicted metal-dependent peptidase